MRARAISLLVASFVLAACGQKPSEPPAEPAAAAPAVVAAPPVAPAPPAPAAPDLPAVPAGAKVLFVEPADGAKIEGPLENGKVTVHVKMGAEGIAIKPAGAVEAGSGHHHILVDADAVAPSGVVPKDEQHLHFGQGQTEATLALTPGKHTLRLQLADGLHRSYGPQLSANVEITVVAAGSVAAEPEPTPAAGRTKKAL